MKTRLNRFKASESIQRPGYESRVNLHHDAEPRAKVVLEGVAIFFLVRTGPVYDGDGFNAVRLFRVISIDSAERDSLDESSAFLIEGARCVRCYARRFGANRRNAHAKAQAALGPGLRQTSHAIVRPLRPTFLSFSFNTPTLRSD